MLRANRDHIPGDDGPAPAARESERGLDRPQVHIQASLDRVVQWMHDQFPPAKTTLTEADDRSNQAYVFRVEQGAPSPTLLISQAVFHHHRAEEIITALERSHVAARLRSDPITRLRCVEQEGRIVVVQRPSWRRRPLRGLPAFIGRLQPDPLKVAAAIVAALPDAVVVTALDRSVLVANLAAAALLGRRGEDLPGMWIDELVVPSRRPDVAERERRALEGEEQRYETTVARADGTEREVGVVATRLVLEGQLIGVVATLRDITAQRLAPQTLGQLGLPTWVQVTSHSMPSSSQMSPPRGAALSNNTQRPSGDHTG